MNLQPNAAAPRIEPFVKTLSTSARSPRDAALDMAITWYRGNLDQHLSSDHGLAVRRCAAHIRFECGLTAPQAETMAMQALGMFEYRSGSAHIDINRSTSFVVFLVDPETGREFALTAAELARWLRLSTDTAPHVRAHQPDAGSPTPDSLL